MNRLSWSGLIILLSTPGARGGRNAHRYSAFLLLLKLAAFLLSRKAEAKVIRFSVHHHCFFPSSFYFVLTSFLLCFSLSFFQTLAKVLARPLRPPVCVGALTKVYFAISPPTRPSLGWRPFQWKVGAPISYKRLSTSPIVLATFVEEQAARVPSCVRYSTPH